MALLAKKSKTTREGTSLTEYYLRVEPQLLKCGKKLHLELFPYASKDAYSNGGCMIDCSIDFEVDYTVTNDGYVLYGLHLLAKQWLLNENNWVDTDVDIVDIDIPN